MRRQCERLTSRGRAATFVFVRALVVGRTNFPADKQGTPVQTRDGPAAVTRQLTHVAFCLPLLLKT